MATITASATGGAWNTNGAWVGGVQPTAADDVTLTAASGAISIPNATTSLCRSLDCTGFVSSLTFGSTTASLFIGDALGGKCLFVNTMTLVLTGIGTIVFNATTASTTYQLTTAGLTMPSLTVAVGTSTTIQFADNVTATGATLTLTQGIWDFNGKTVSASSFASSNSNTRTLTLGNAQITLNGGTAWNMGNPTAALTMTANTATVTCSGTTAFFTCGPFNLNGLSIVMSGLGVATLQGGFTAANFTRTGTAGKTDSLSVTSTPTLTGTVTLTGNSLINRLLVQSSVIGTSRTITAAAISLTNVDFEDITGAGLAANAAWTGSSLGDCLGNSNITFDAPVTQTNTGATGNWSDSSKWTSRVPLPQDNVIINTGSGTITMDMPRAGANTDFTGFTGTASFSSVTTTFFGNFTLASGMTVSGTQGITFGGRGSQTITSAGRAFTQITLTIASPGGTYTLQDALVESTSLAQGSLTISGGTFSTGGMPVTVGLLQVNSGTTFTAGTSTITLYRTDAITILNVNSSSTASFASSTIIIANATAVTRSLSTGGKTYGTLTYTVANSPGPLLILATTTFNTINISSGRVLTFQIGTTNTVNNLFNATGVNNGYEYLPGVAASYVSTPDAAPLQVVGDVTIDARLALSSWAAVGPIYVAAKWTNTAATSSYLLSLTSGNIRLQFSDGTTLFTGTSTAAVAFTANATGWIRATRQKSSGTTQFYTSPDGVTWTQLGTNVTLSAGTAINNSAQVLEIGTYATGTQGTATLSAYEVRMYASYQGTGSPVFDANFTTKPFGANSFTESSTNAATVTINGSTAQAGDGRILLNSSTPGTKATLLSPKLQSVDYFTIQDSNAPAVGWYAGTHSINVSNNSGWIFTAPPALSNNQLMLEGVG